MNSIIIDTILKFIKFKLAQFYIFSKKKKKKTLHNTKF